MVWWVNDRFPEGERRVVRQLQSASHLDGLLPKSEPVLTTEGYSFALTLIGGVEKGIAFSNFGVRDS